jgi:hypothetical protein
MSLRILRLLWDPEELHHTHKSGQVVRVLIQTNTAGKTYTQVMKIHLKFDIQRTVHSDIFL